MRMVVQVFAAIFLVSLLLGSALMVAINFHKVMLIDEINEHSENLTQYLSTDMLKVAAGLWFVLALGSIVGIVAVFLKRHRFGLYLGMGLFVLSSITVVVQPSVELVGANDPKYTGYAIAFFGAIGVILLMAVHTWMKPKPS